MPITISASLVKELRERTQGGLLECKKALEESGGDIEKAIELMRKSGVAKAAKKAGRVAAEGIIAIASSGKKAVIAEINCETDFVARSDNFINFANSVVNKALAIEAKSVDELLKATADENKTIAHWLDELIGKIGEKIVIRRLAYVESPGIIGSYLHGQRIGVLVKLSIDDAVLGKDIAMHIAASKPMVISTKDVPAELIQKEREIFLAQVESSGKPPEILQKMVNGKVNKFVDEVTLLQQPFIKDPNIKVSDLLQKAKGEVLEFIRYEVGEGIEKKEVDFASEVMAQVEGKR
jgi:elongation factor Ts